MSVSEPRGQIYRTLIPQVTALLEGESDAIANLANVSAALKEAFQWWWVGFYLVKDDELVLGPFQGPVACTRIAKGKGVCGSCWEIKHSIIVPDVHLFPGHIACSAESKSEIVVPLIHDGQVWAVLDIDSRFINDFHEEDQFFLEQIVTLL